MDGRRSNQAIPFVPDSAITFSCATDAEGSTNRSAEGAKDGRSGFVKGAGARGKGVDGHGYSYTVAAKEKAPATVLSRGPRVFTVATGYGT